MLNALRFISVFSFKFEKSGADRLLYIRPLLHLRIQFLDALAEEPVIFARFVGGNGDFFFFFQGQGEELFRKVKQFSDQVGRDSRGVVVGYEDEAELAGGVEELLGRILVGGTDVDDWYFDVAAVVLSRGHVGRCFFRSIAKMEKRRR